MRSENRPPSVAAIQRRAILPILAAFFAAATLSFGGPPDGTPAPTPDKVLPPAGTFCGLFYENGTANPGGSGYFTFTMTKGAAFVGSLHVKGGVYAFAGEFDASQAARVIVPREGKPPLTASFAFGAFKPGEVVLGAIGDGHWASPLMASRMPAHPALPLVFAGDVKANLAASSTLQAR